MRTFTRDDLAKDLQKLGLRSGDCVMLHSSLSSLGMVEGGAATVVEAFLDAMEPGGTLLTPAFTQGAWTEHLAMPECRACCPRDLCPATWPSHEGAIANAALNRPGRLRSCHPTHSWVGNGPRAVELLKDHQHSPTACGRGNPFEKLVELDGCIVTLGVGVNTITLWHYYEDLLGLPYMGHYHPKERHLSYTATGQRIQYSFPNIMQDVVRAAGIMDFGKVGRGTSGLMRAETFRRFMATIIADDPYCLLVRPPDRHDGDLALDALAKAAAMLRAWAVGPNELPERLDLPDGNDNDLVREDCPAFAGYHEAGGRQWPLCRANARHPDLFRYGGIFDENGKTTCGRCPWHWNR
ncbi:MAG: AAC(3) family N-acetyltransferase [Planctomycetota bacterium]|nr:AAC(3) family N-acetyltransferase [Planctomycetota bacterium]